MEDATITVALLSLLGTIIGSASGILVANKLVNFRLDHIEKSLENYANNQDEIKERLVICEQSTKSAHHRLDGIVAELRLTEKRSDG